MSNKNSSIRFEYNNMKFDDIIKQVEDIPYSAFFFTPPIYPKSFSVIFSNPVEIISTASKADLPLALRFLDKNFNKGLNGYCLINYEAGYLFEPKLQSLLTGEKEKLIQIFFFDKKGVQRIKSSKIEFEPPNVTSYQISDFRLSTSEKKYFSDIRKIKKYLEAGDTYQVNYTVKANFRFTGDFASFYKKLLFNQSARYSAFINNNDSIIISLSPELFFRLKGKKVTSMPMKGTAGRGIDEKEDLLKKSELATGEKNKAENVMIVDLIRNDLGKICKYGSVQVPSLFSTEKYESLFQLVSTIRGKLKKNCGLSDVIASMSPCGSVTGAPKIRTMEIINEIEKKRRAIYTGSIGLMLDGKATFNVAIRTLSVEKKSKKGVMGIGSGIVWDSHPAEEWKETLLKSSFLKEPADFFQLFETMLFDSGKILFFEEHIARLKAAADFFLFFLNEKKLLNRISDEVLRLDSTKKYKLRVLLGKWGNIGIGSEPFESVGETNSIILSENPVNSRNRYLYFKTTNRKFYDTEYLKFSRSGFFDVIFINERGEITEGSISNIFLRKKGFWVTPPVSAGILPGIFRSYLLKTQPDTIEASVSINDLAEAEDVKMVNSVRGEVRIDKIYFNRNEFVEIKSK